MISFTATRTRRLVGTLASFAASFALLGAQLPHPGPLGVGDRLFPELGNPGYDVSHYVIDLTYSGDNTDPLEGITTITARATGGGLSRFNLDFTGGTVRDVTVDGRAARFRSAGEDLVITPAGPVGDRQTFEVTVRHTSPTGERRAGGWIRTGDGLVMANQPAAAHHVFPGNDHPSDKAHFTFRITAPENLTVVASGAPVGRERAGSTVTWTYRTAHPMATQLAQVSIGDSSVVGHSGPHGLPLRDVVRRADQESLRPWLERTPGHLEWLEERLGRYPFDRYGVLLADADFDFALETQTLSLFPRALFTSAEVPDWSKDGVMVHELAHQWFGNSVTPERWSDLWLSEGHATWYAWLHSAENGGPAFTERVREAYSRSDAMRAAAGPPARVDSPPDGSGGGADSAGDDRMRIFQPVVYDGAVVVLYALRQRIGEDAFDRVERAWLSRYRDGTAGTDDFIALASQVAGQDLTAFLTDWLYGRRTPAMPGHSDWRQREAGTGVARTPG